MSRKNKKILKNRSKNMRGVTPNTEYINERLNLSESEKNDAKISTNTISFYKIKTINRNFFVNSIDEIKEKLSDDEKFFIVTNIEYISEFRGKEDVLKISDNNIHYITHMGTGCIIEYDEQNSQKLGREIWKSRHFNYLEPYYTWLRENGIILRNDVYKRQQLLKEVVSSILN